MDMRTLFPPQQAVLDHGILDLGFSSVLSLPTGAGKTTLAEMAIDLALARGEKVAYLTPLKALAEEKIMNWGHRWRGHKVGIYTGDYSSSSSPLPYREAQILICTYEKLDGILRHWQRHLDWLARLGLVVVDEFHLLMDPTRGPRLEGTISRLKRVNPFCRVMGLSGTLSNHAELASWLGGISFHSTWRPVPLKHEIHRFKRLSDKPGLVIDIVAETSLKDGQTLIFVSSRRRAEQLATAITASGHSASHHHAGMGLSRRQEVELKFRAGALECLVATPTLEMGLNLPCRTVVVADNTRWNGETFAPLPIWNYLQRAGRAGRPGQDGEGRAILLAPTWARDLPDYQRADPEPVKSQLTKKRNLAEQVLIEVASRSSRTRAQLQGAFFPSTLTFLQSPDSSSTFASCVDELVEADMIREKQCGTLQTTPIGWSAVRQQLTPASVQHLLKIQSDAPQGLHTDFDLLLHHCWDNDLQPKLPVSIETVDALEEHIQPIPSQMLDQAPPDYLSPRACAAGVLMATLSWMYMQQGMDVDSACEDLDVYPSDAGLLRQSLVRLLKASADVHAAKSQLAAKTDPTERQFDATPSISSTLQDLALKLEYGLPGDAIQLTRIPGCGGKLAKRLYQAGITDLEELCVQEPQDLALIPGIGLKRAHAWIAAAEELIKDQDLDHCRQFSQHERTVAKPSDWPADIDPGRLHRALGLTVSLNRSTYCVSGGAEEHLVEDDQCDCADYGKNGAGWWCKHRLAVRLSTKDKLISSLAHKLNEIPRPAGLAGNLAELTLGRRWQHA